MMLSKSERKYLRDLIESGRSIEDIPLEKYSENHWRVLAFRISRKLDTMQADVFTKE